MIRVLMTGGWLVSQVATAAPATARDCPDLKSTLHEYRVQEHGPSYLKGQMVFGTIADGEHCEKLRRVKVSIAAAGSEPDAPSGCRMSVASSLRATNKPSRH